jgi:hypothetical protein
MIISGVLSFAGLIGVPLANMNIRDITLFDDPVAFRLP